MKDSIDLLLINPGDVRQVYQHLGKEFSAIELPIFCAMFADMVRRQGFSVAILDVPANEISAVEASRIAVSMKPKLIGLVVYGLQPSASTQNMPSACRIASGIKDIDPTAKIFMTGTHPAALPERTLLEEAVDFVFTGDGITTLPELLAAIKSNDTAYEKVRGLCFLKDGKAIKTAPPALLRDLDAVVPALAFDLLPMNKYRAHNWHCLDDVDKRMPYASLHTTLGCPYQCAFCCINTPFSGPNYEYSGPTYRFWKPQTIVSWIDKLVNDYGVRNIKFADEMYFLNKAHNNTISDLLIDRGYDLNIWAYARVDSVKDGVLEKSAKAGFKWYCLGIESGSKHVRDSAEKALKNEDILKVVRQIQDSGINVIGNYIFGLPDDNFDTMQETLNLAIEANCEFANFYSAMAYPGSPLHALAKDKNYELPDSPGGPGWIGYSQHSYDTLPLPTEFILAKDVLAFREYAMQAYFNHPRYLKMIQDKFGEKARQHIKKMISQPPLLRKILD